MESLLGDTGINNGTKTRTEFAPSSGKGILGVWGLAGGKAEVATRLWLAAGLRNNFVKDSE